MIEANYYSGLVAKLKTNPKITRIPTHAELHDAGCEATGICYLVAPNGQQFNPAIVNPEIMPEEIAHLFVGVKADQPIELVYETDGKDEFKDSPVPMPDLKLNHDSSVEPIAKYCPQCSTAKPLDHFGKKAGRGGKNRKDVCKECEEKIKAKTIGDITGLSTQELKHEEPNAEPIDKEQFKCKIIETLTKRST